ncbi:MAG: molybdopterin-dependent oxidoreductase [Chloroflexota bacterium]|nr:molybdopterin-dependent oxidoreductase [Chloroflexota bacterium]
MTQHDMARAPDADARPAPSGAWNGAIAGGIAAALATVVMLVLRLVADVPSLPELVQEWITTWLPVSTFGAFLDTFEGSAKALAFGALFALYVLAGALIGVLLGSRWARPRALRSPALPPQESLGALLLQGLLAGGALLVLALIVLRPTASVPGISLPFLLFGLLLPLCYRWLSPVAPTVAVASVPVEGSDEAPPQGVADVVASDLPVGAGRGLTEVRRRQLERLGWGSVAAAGLLALWRYVSLPADGTLLSGLAGMGSSPGSRGSRRGPDGLPAEVTANDDFYLVSKNLRDPRPDRREWRLHINGLVGRPIVFTWAELRALPHREQWQTLICISNEVGGDYFGNALWTGIPVADLIRLAGGTGGRAGRVVFRAADGYSDSLPLAKAMDPSTLVATTMNGVDLPDSHGAPARLMIPGVYGMKNVKWLNTIEVVDTPFRGYWQQRGWTDAAVVKTTSRIDFPRRGSVSVAQAGRIAGVAFAGDRGISRVEVSDDDGANWRAARLAPPKGPFTWVFWEAPWSPAAGAQYKLAVRATDGAGVRQAIEASPALPDGASGYHSITVRVT